MLKQCVKHYYQWLSATIQHKPKLVGVFPDSVRIQGPFKIQLWLLVFSLSCQKRHRKVENVKSRFGQDTRPFQDPALAACIQSLFSRKS